MNNFSRERFVKSWKPFFSRNSALRSKNLQKCIFWIWWITEEKLWDEERMQRWWSEGSIQGEIPISSSSFTIFYLEVLHTLLRTLTFYKARKSTWPTMKKALFEKHTSTNIINKMSMSCANGDASFYNKEAATKNNNNLYGLWLLDLFKRRKLS